MKIEIDRPSVIMEDMIVEQETLNSSCFISDEKYILKNKIQDYISQDFIREILTQYKLNKPTSYINIKISKQND
jgi:hypothetical protein